MPFSAPVSGIFGRSWKKLLERGGAQGIDDGFEDEPTGLGFALPPGWGADEPFFYETAGGVKADTPTMEFYLRDDLAQGALIVLNPIRQAPGPCTATNAGDLCHVGTGPAQAAAEAIAPTLSLKEVAE